ncbi:MAG: recombinase RecA [Firmicutes bacterium]|nr:recombinase RecA [Bacillota bacterium]
MAVANEKPAKESEKEKALNAALAMIEKVYGKGAIMRMSDGPVIRNVNVIPTGCLVLDHALGIGGIPRGRITEIYGPESSGKTTVSLHIVAEAQKMGLKCAFIDAEHALDPIYAEKLGVRLQDLIVSQPDSGDQGLDIVEKLISSGVIDLVVVDSVAALTPRQEIEGDIGDTHVGLQARLMSQALRKLTPIAAKTDCAIMFINQLREKIGNLMPGQSPETTTGGKALKFYASVRLDIRRIGSIDATTDGTKNFIGNKTKVKVVKNKLAPPFKVVEFEIMFGKGISQEGCILDLALNYGLVEKSGAWFSYNGDKIGQGREKVKENLETNLSLREELLTKVRAKMEGKKEEEPKQEKPEIKKEVPGDEVF